MTESISVLYLYKNGDASLSVSKTIDRAAYTIRKHIKTRECLAIAGKLYLNGKSMSFELGSGQGLNSIKDVAYHLKSIRYYHLILTDNERVAFNRMTKDERDKILSAL